jgi:hypothetical protein
MKVTSEKLAKFMQDVAHRFGVHNTIRTTFIGFAFWDFCQDNTINVYYSSVAQPRCNGQVKCANDMVLQAIKDCIFDDASNYATRWLAALPHVIWGQKTQVSSATGFSPFFFGLQLRDHPTHRCHFWIYTHTILRGGRSLADSSCRP